MGRPKGWASEQTGRPVMRSPGRPAVGRREHRQRFWAAVARGARAARRPGSRRVCRRRSASGGFGRVVACRRSPWPRRRVGICRSWSARRSRFCVRRVRASARSPGGSGVRRRRSRVSCAATPPRVAAGWTIEPRRLSGTPTCAPGARSRRSWPSTHSCVPYVQDRLSGAVKRPDGSVVAGPEVRWVGRRHGRRQDRRWGQAWSPEQISARLRLDFPDDESMRVSHEAIYQSLYVQGRGALRRELTACLRTGRALRVPRARAHSRGKGFITQEVMISQRPAEAADRAVPGHWEGDLILGWAARRSARSWSAQAGFTMLLYLPPMIGQGPRVHHGPAVAGHGAEAVRDAISRRDRHAATAVAPLADLGPGRRDGPARSAACPARAAGLLLRPPEPVAAREQREHQRTAAPVLPPRHRSRPPRPRGPRRRRRRSEQPAPQDAGLENPGRSTQRVPVN